MYFNDKQEAINKLSTMEVKGTVCHECKRSNCLSYFTGKIASHIIDNQMFWYIISPGCSQEEIF